MPRRRRITRKLHERLVERMFEADRPIRQLSDELGLSLTQLARWMNQPHAREALGGLARLADARTQMLLSTYRANAAARLIEMATSGKPTEKARKACVDLLRTNLGALEAQPGDAADETDGAPEPRTEAAILRAFERMAEPIP
jgi:transposase-like protein